MIAVLEIIGGIVGILFMAWVSIMSGFALNVISVVPISLAIFTLSLVAGVYLWSETEFGRRASIVVQFIQLPKIATSALVFMFSFGLDVFPQLVLNNGQSFFGIQFRFLADSQLFFLSSGSTFILGFSLTSIIAIHKLWFYEVGRNEIPAEASETPPSPEIYFDDSTILKDD